MDEHAGLPVPQSHANSGEQLAQELRGIQQEKNSAAARRWRARGNITGGEVAKAFGRAMYSIYVDRRSGAAERVRKPLDIRLIDRFVAKRLAKSTEAAPVSPDEEAEVLAEFDAVYRRAWRWHGTGRYQHRGGQTVDILREISGDGGLRPHEDAMDPIVGEMDSVSTAASRMYARPYADMHQDRGEPMSYRYGKASYWAQFFVSPIALEGLIELKAWRKGPARDRARKVGSEGLSKWRNKVNESAWQKNIFPIFDQGSDIAGNYPILIGIKAGSFYEVQISKTLSRFESRSEQLVPIEAFSHLEVPLDKVEETRAKVAEGGYSSLFVLSIEQGEYFCSKQSFSDLISGNRLCLPGAHAPTKSRFEPPAGLANSPDAST
jgi:hypothetical protein